ncbi:MAG: 1-deoxy-D-xylulose-5-phosphate reductoisomerase, partial [Candidatus Hydrogenedentes bacterium]|nr:1-deoxy-D-xylulose-5-phosphate reductoisomerase [Candidatus Hydrogenedentota bacterium]
MSCTPRRITILGSTGSIGTSALDVVRHYPERFEVIGLAANANVDLLAKQVREFQPKYVAVANREAARKLSEQMPGINIVAGCEGLEEIAAAPADVVLCGIVGAVG